jgi:hypothetical protein
VNGRLIFDKELSDRVNGSIIRVQRASDHDEVVQVAPSKSQSKFLSYRSHAQAHLGTQSKAGAEVRYTFPSYPKNFRTWSPRNRPHPHSSDCFLMQSLYTRDPTARAQQRRMNRHVSPFSLTLATLFSKSTPSSRKKTLPLALLPLFKVRVTGSHGHLHHKYSWALSQ